MAYATGTVVLLAFPFSDALRAKQRPALVLLDLEDEDIVVARVTSQQPKSEFGVTLRKWREAGLLLPSVVRLHKVATLEKSLVKRTLGQLTKEDEGVVRVTLEQMWRSF